jgi:hypothetical protein
MTRTSATPLKAYQVAAAVGLIESDKTYPQTREYIKEIIADGTPIGSCSKGFFLIQTAKEMQAYLNSLMKRQIALSKRITNLYDACKGKGIV